MTVHHADFGTRRADPQQPVALPVADWAEALARIAQHYRLPVSTQGLKLSGQADKRRSDRDRVDQLARATGLRIAELDNDAVVADDLLTPMIVWLDDGRPGVITAIGADGQARLGGGAAGIDNVVPLARLKERARCFLAVRPVRAIPDRRVDDYIRPYQEHWLRKLIFRDIRSYGHVVVASLIANCLALAGILFSMQVYDRVIPAQSYPTLYVLFGGVLIAVGFEFLLLQVRMRIVDVLGKRVDLRMSDLVFGHALRVRGDARPKSTGTFIAQLRDLDQMRELLTSTTVTALVDIPFFLLFAVILFSISGLLALVPVVALVVLILPGLLAQRRLRAHANQAMREASLRNAMLVETVQGLDDLKMLQAEHRFQSQWNHFNAITADAQLRLRSITNSLSAWTRSIRTAVYGAVVFFGGPMVISGDITTGALVASSILSSRMMAPIAQLSQVLGRIQQARVAASSLDQLMALPVDDPGDAQRISAPRLMGRYEMSSIVLRHGEDAPPALTVQKLEFDAGETVALLGRNGAGKSTLLHALAGMLSPVSGRILIDGLAMNQVDPADLRREIGYVGQQSRLFHGTIRDNLTLGAVDASDDQLMRALTVAGAENLIRGLTAGLEHPIMEGGKGLSGGQIQALLLARVIVRDPNIVLLDEPTASMDDAAERNFIRRFAKWSRGKTVIVATHRLRVLELMRRVVLLHEGAVQLDDRKDVALRAMQGAGLENPA